MKSRKSTKFLTYITLSCCVAIICACGNNQSKNEIESDAQKESTAEMEQNFMEKSTVELKTEPDKFDSEAVKAFLTDMDHDMRNLTDRMDKQEAVPEKEIINCIKKYYEEDLINYAMFLYRIRPAGDGYFHDRQYGTTNYMMDTDAEMRMIVQNDDFCEVGVTFEYHWERS